MSENEREIGRNIGKESKRRRVLPYYLIFEMLFVVCILSSSDKK